MNEQKRVQMREQKRDRRGRQHGYWENHVHMVVSKASAYGGFVRVGSVCGLVSEQQSEHLKAATQNQKGSCSAARNTGSTESTLCNVQNKRTATAAAATTRHTQHTKRPIRFRDHNLHNSNSLTTEKARLENSTSRPQSSQQQQHEHGESTI